MLLTGVYSMRLYFGLFVGELISQYKIVLLVGLCSFLPFLRLIGRSVLLRRFIFFFWGPFIHNLLICSDKFFALGVFVSGVLIAFLCCKVLKRMSHLLRRRYLLYFNPMCHKVSSLVRFWCSRAVRLFDYILMEFLFYGGVKYVWSVGVSYRLFLVLLIRGLLFFL